MVEYKHWKEYMENTYLGAWSLKPGEEKVLTIANIKSELVTAVGGVNELCMVAYFKEEGTLPMVLNRTNCKIIEKLYGESAPQWIGQRIQIYATTTRFGSQTNVPCLRVRNFKPNGAVEYHCSVCGKVIPQEVYQKSVEKLGKAYCGKDCYIKDTQGEDVLK